MDILRWIYRRKKRPSISSVDELAQQAARLYVGLVERDGTLNATFRNIRARRYFLTRLENLNQQREKGDREAVELRGKISAIRERVYSSRLFPSTLKAIIFERDNYMCRLCLRDRENLQKAGLNLECDHILAWEDGGLTSYDNGQTVCSECNKAKHHAKHYLGLISRLHGGRSQK